MLKIPLVKKKITKITEDAREKGREKMDKTRDQQTCFKCDNGYRENMTGHQ